MQALSVALLAAAEVSTQASHLPQTYRGPPLVVGKIFVTHSVGIETRLCPSDGGGDDGTLMVQATVEGETVNVVRTHELATLLRTTVPNRPMTAQLGLGIYEGACGRKPT